MADYYQLLGLSQAASKEEVKAAFKKLAVTLHPDKNPGNPLTEELFKQINEAYQVLSDKDKRAVYDLKLLYAANPPLPHYPEYSQEPQSDYASPRPTYQRRAFSYGRSRYASRVEYAPGYVRKMSILMGTLFVLFLVGVVYFSLWMNHRNALEYYQEALEEGKSTAAMLKFSEAISFDKEFWQAYYQRGGLRMTLLGDYRHARNDFNAALRYTDKPSASMYYNRGLCSYQLKQYREALADFNQALRLDTRNGSAYYLRSLTYLITQDTTRACQDWRQAVQLGVNFPEDSLGVYCK